MAAHKQRDVSGDLPGTVGAGYAAESVRVIAWQPLPEPYQEER
jgi:hypothetical protein